MPAIEPRPYQDHAFDALREGYRRGHRSQLLVLPTGGGKTTVAVRVIRATVDKGGRALFVAHRKELIDQASRRLDDFSLDHGVIMARHPRHAPWLPVQVASIQTLDARKEKLDLAEPTLVIFDEAHRAAADTYRAVRERWPHARCLGLTATPWRSDGHGLKDAFDAAVVAATPAELMALGNLVPVRGFTCPVGRDDDDRPPPGARRINKHLVEEWLRRHRGTQRRTVLFAPSLELSARFVDQFNQAGIPAEHLDGRTDRRRREAILARFRDGQTLVVSNLGILTEGWDEPRTQVVILARPTDSVALALQMMGRGLRPCADLDKPHLYLHDHAGVIAQHGLPEDDRDYTLAATRDQQPRPIARRSCPACGRVCALERACPECGGDLDAVDHRGTRVELVSTETVDLDVVRERHAQTLLAIRERIDPATRAAELRRLQEVAARKGYAPGWAAVQYRRTFGERPEALPADLRARAVARRTPVIPPELLRQAGV